MKEVNVNHARILLARFLCLIIGLVKYSIMKSDVYDLIKYTILPKYMIMTESIRSFQMIHLLKIYDHLFKSKQFSEISIKKNRKYTFNKTILSRKLYDHS